MATELDMNTIADFSLDLIGREISRIRLVKYVGPDKHVEEDDVQLELELNDGSIIRFTGAADGETVVVCKAPWEDPFEEPLSPENEEYIRTHGKWTVFDMSNAVPCMNFVGLRIENVKGIVNKFGKIAGLLFVTNTGDISFYVDCDEGKALFHSESTFSGTEEFTVKDLSEFVV